MYSSSAISLQEAKHFLFFLLFYQQLQSEMFHSMVIYTLVLEASISSVDHIFSLRAEFFMLLNGVSHLQHCTYGSSGKPGGGGAFKGKLSITGKYRAEKSKYG